jgi:hypothetical protein
VGIRGSQFTLNGDPTYTASGGFSAADPSIEGTLLNVRAVQGIFDDAHYPSLGSREHPYKSSLGEPVFFDYPDGPFSPSRNLSEFLEALPAWRRVGLLAFTVNLQGGGPSDGNFGIHDQPHLNSGFDSHGNLKPAYAARLKKVIERADQLGMVVIVGFFYQGSEHWVEMAADDGYANEAIRQASLFLKGLPHRNILIEIANEVSAKTYNHPVLRPDGILGAVRLAQSTVQHEIPVSFSETGPLPPLGSPESSALRAVDFVLIHTNHASPEGVQKHIQSMRDIAGHDRPVLINEDGVSIFSLTAATESHVGWGYYDQGLNDYRDGFQSPPVNWQINTIPKWVFFDQVARLSGSPAPLRPVNSDADSPHIRVKGLAEGQTIKEHISIEAVVGGVDPRWPVRRVEFFLDRAPYSYSLKAPYMLGNKKLWDAKGISNGNHTLRIVVYFQRGPAFTETSSLLEIPFAMNK